MLMGLWILGSLPLPSPSLSSFSPSFSLSLSPFLHSSSFPFPSLFFSLSLSDFAETGFVSMNSQKSGQEVCQAPV